LPRSASATTRGWAARRWTSAPATSSHPRQPPSSTTGASSCRCTDPRTGEVSLSGPLRDSRRGLLTATSPDRAATTSSTLEASPAQERCRPSMLSVVAPTQW